MNEREQAVLALIRKNPFMSQQEMADKMNLSRPVLANLVSSLTKQGKIVTVLIFYLRKMKLFVSVAPISIANFM